MSNGYIEHKRGHLLHRLCILTVVTLIVSVASMIVGIVMVAESGSRFPYSAGGAIIGGVMSLLFTCCPFWMYYEGRKSYGEDTTECFDCCVITMAVWFSLTILAIPIGLGISGAYGLAECLNPPEDGVCFENTDHKLALSVVTIIISVILMFLTLAIFFTCCCNARTFGTPLLAEPSIRYIPDYQTSVIQESRRRDMSAGFQPRRAVVDNRSNYNSENNDQYAGGLSVRLPPLDTISREPSAPPPSWDRGSRDERRHTEESSRTFDAGHSHPVYGDTRNPSRYDDLPPSYEEVINAETIV